MMRKQFFVYVFTDPRRGHFGEPFYVGKGSGHRVIKHFWYKNHPNVHLGRRIAAIEKTGAKVGVTVIDVDSEFLAFELECLLISMIGRRSVGSGPLCNLTLGGEGLAGFQHSDESKSLISKSKAGKKQDPDVVARRNQKNTGQKRTPDQRARMAEAARKRFADPVKRKEFSELRKQQTADPDYRRRLSEAKKGVPPKPEVLAASAAARRAKAEQRRLTLKEINDA
jgi:hypothetical protein